MIGCRWTGPRAGSGDHAAGTAEKQSALPNERTPATAATGAVTVGKHRAVAPPGQPSQQMSSPPSQQTCKTHHDLASAVLCIMGGMPQSPRHGAHNNTRQGAHSNTNHASPHLAEVVMLVVAPRHLAGKQVLQASVAAAEAAAVAAVAVCLPPCFVAKQPARRVADNPSSCACPHGAPPLHGPPPASCSFGCPPCPSGPPPPAQTRWARPAGAYEGSPQPGALCNSMVRRHAGMCAGHAGPLQCGANLKLPAHNQQASFCIPRSTLVAIHSRTPGSCRTCCSSAPRARRSAPDAACAPAWPPAAPRRRGQYPARVDSQGVGRRSAAVCFRAQQTRASPPPAGFQDSIHAEPQQALVTTTRHAPRRCCLLCFTKDALPSDP